MNTAFFRTFVIFAACIALALFLGFTLAGPLTYTSLFAYGLIAFILMFPIFLRWHYPLMLLSWNMTAAAFLLPGRPSLCLVMIALSLGISVMQRMISRDAKFIGVPQITLPIFALLAVIAVTAKLTGFGLRVFGSASYGANKYFYLVGGILGYFALCAQRIPLQRKNLYIGLFFLGGVVAIIGDLLPLLPHQFYFIYWVFQPNTNFLSAGNIGAHETRLSGLWITSMSVLSFMLVRYGIRGIFLERKPWRWLLFCTFSIAGLFGGFRGFIVLYGLTFMVQFFLEGLHRTKFMGVLLAGGLLVGLALIPLAEHLPYTFQRALSILPYKVSTAARLDAEASLNWRLNMWQAILPQVPKYLLLGKGYVINPLDYEFVMGPEASIHSTFAQNDALALSEDFHNGPLSIVIPFGIWGCIAFLWFIFAAARVFYRNFRYSAPELRTTNAALLAAFIAETIFFFFVFGGINSDMLKFCGLLGLSVALNGGMRRPVHVLQRATQTAKPKAPAHMPLPAPAFQRRLPGIR